jgi:hypothetical protein
MRKMLAKVIRWILAVDVEDRQSEARELDAIIRDTKK